MADPNDVGTVAGIIGGAGVVGMGLLKLWKQFFADRADAANAQAEIQMLREYQTENKELRARLDTKDQQIAALMQEKFTYQADLKSALDKIQYMSAQIEDLKSELTAIKDAVRGPS
jgi:peptidoglycan hydrolase CwlO-like protein